MNKPRHARYPLVALLLAGIAFAPSGHAHSPAGGHTTTTAIVCTPSSLGINQTATCTATVTDIVGNGQDAVPAGTVTLSSSAAGNFSATSCTLAPAGGFAASCAVTYTPTVFASHVITATYPTTTNAFHRWAGSVGTTTLFVLAPPTVAKTFAPATVATLLSSTLTITLSNSNAAAITGVALTDAYPANLVNAAVPAASTTCGGAVTAVAGVGSVSLSGGTIPASGSCTVTVSVTSSVAGSYANTVPVGAVSSTNAGSNTVASGIATLAILDRPGVSKAFSAASIPTGGSSTLTITLSNTNSVAITGVAFSDTYPAGLSNASGASTSCGGVVSTPTTGSLQLSGGTIPASSSCTVSVSVTSGAAGAYPNSIPVGGVTSTNAAWNLLAASATLTVTAVVAAFDAVEIGAAPRTKLYTKLGSVVFSIDILALDASDAVSAGYTGTVTLDLVDASSGGGVCIAMTSVKPLGSVTFAAPDAGRKTLSVSYTNALRTARIRIADAALGITSCSFDAFAIRPLAFTVSSSMTNATTTGAPVARAGENFTLTATATSGYDGTPAIVAGRLAAHAGATQTGTLSGAFSAAASATGVAQGANFTYGEVGNFQLLSQGVVDESFTAVDQPGDCTDDYSNVLVGGRYGCKFGNASATSFFGRFIPDHFTLSGATLTDRSAAGCLPASVFTYMGEAMGIAFTLTAKNAAGTTTRNYTSASGFSKLDAALPASFNFVARDASVAAMRTVGIVGITKANPGQATTASAHNFVSGDRVFITGVNGMTQINGLTVTVTVVDATRFTIGVDTSGAGFGAYTSGGMASRLAALSSSGTWISGAADISATARLERSVAPDGPFAALTVGVAPRDGDDVGLMPAMLDFDADANSANESFALGTTDVRFGRMRLSNASGTTLLDLPLTLEAQYFNGVGFVRNANDSCTRLADGSIAMDFAAAQGLQSCETALVPTGILPLSNGVVAGLRLLKPGVGNDGRVDLRVNLNGASGNTCSAVGPGPGSPAANATLPFLQGNWTGAAYDQDPRARAAFGVRRNANEFIHLQENF